MFLDKLHEEELRQLTGCDYRSLMRIKQALSPYFPMNKPGRPYKYSLWTMLIVTLIKLRGEAAYRSLQIFLRINFVTIHRYVNKICNLLADMTLFQEAHHRYLIVDGTCVRVRSDDSSNYSGYKHHKNRKVQVIVDDQRRIVAVSRCHPGSVHDKKIWNHEYKLLEHLFDKIVLGDKGYAGGTGENKVLFRPIKRNEIEYKNKTEEAKAFNRELSRWRVTVEHVFAQLKTFKILRGIFPLKASRFGTCFRAIAYIHNINLEVKNMKH